MFTLFPTWANTMGMDLSFTLSLGNLFFSLLVIFIGFGVFLYSSIYMKHFDLHSKTTFYLSLSLFTLAMLGLILTEHLLVLFLFWEMTSACSFFLIGLKNGKEQVRKQAKWALYTTVGGGLFLLAGTLTLGQIGMELGLANKDAYSISLLIDRGGVTTHELFPLAFISIFIGIASKSALFPFSFWLPLAMAGPTPVSSFLHSATMVKAGLILAFKLLPLMGSSDLWGIVFIGSGSITALLAAFQCLMQRNLKTMLAYSTTCVLGLLAILLGLNTEKSIITFVQFVLAHAFYKAALFQMAGYLDVRYKTMDFFEVSKFNIQDPLASITVIISCLSMVGIPLTLGFYAKEYIYLSGIKSNYAIFLIFVFFISNLFMGIQAINFIRVFLPKSSTKTTKPKVGLLLVIPAFIYALTSFILAIAPDTLNLNFFVSLMLSAHLKLPIDVQLKLWHGIDYPYNIVLALSILTILGSFFGSLVYTKKLESISAWSKRNNDFSLWGTFQVLLNSTLHFCKKLTQVIVNGKLRNYIIITTLSISGIVLLGVLDVKGLSWPVQNIRILEMFTLALAALALVIATITQVHYRILINLSLSGLFLVAFFTIHSAIDVSMTQLMVESLSLFFIFFLIKASKIREVIKTKQKVNVLVATFVTLVMASFAFLPKFPFNSNASEFFVKNSKFLAKGENIVNVILVDFRALDTFGEVIVVSVAIVGVMTILRGKDKSR
jgi:multicomponent Na+:H+ antiporter subunit A